MTGRSFSAISRVVLLATLSLDLAEAFGDDGLQLNGPAELPRSIVSTPAPVLTPTAPAREASNRPVLALPRSPLAGPRRPPTEPPTPPALSDAPTLEGPLGTPASDLFRSPSDRPVEPRPSSPSNLTPDRRQASSPRTGTTSAPASAHVPVDEDEFPMARPGSVMPRRTGPSSLGAMFAPPVNSVPTAPTRRFRPFGNLFTTPVPPPAASTSTTAPRTSVSGRSTTTDAERETSIKVEPRTDPAADAALKRRLERQVREAVGNRAREVDVRVAGRGVSIDVHGVRFLQKRAVRRSIEAIPGLSSYKATIDVRD